MKTKPRVYVCNGHEECPRYRVPVKIWPARIADHVMSWLSPFCDHCGFDLTCVEDPNTGWTSGDLRETEKIIDSIGNRDG